MAAGGVGPGSEQMPRRGHGKEKQGASERVKLQNAADGSSQTAREP